MNPQVLSIRARHDKADKIDIITDSQKWVQHEKNLHTHMSPVHLDLENDLIQSL